jgi:lysylphosphatidylglycerol synthetase-like protein (DUF2156 family)
MHDPTLHRPVEPVLGWLPMRSRVGSSHTTYADVIFKREPASMPQLFSLEERIEYLKDHGAHILSVSSLQPGMEYFDVPHVGYIAFRTQGTRDFVLAHPVCARTNLEYVIAAFLREHPFASFVQIDDPLASLLRENFGYYTFRIGVECRLHAERWTLQGKDKTRVRRWLSSAKKAQVTVRELEKDVTLPDIQRVSETWLSTRTSRIKLSFLVRDFFTDPRCAGLCRLFGAYQGGRLVGIVEFTPIFTDTAITGYCADLIQAAPEAPKGTSDLIIVTALETFHREAIRDFSLGLAPLAQLGPCPKEPPLIRQCLALIYRTCNFLYNFQGIYAHKEKYRTNEVPVFYATKRANAFSELIPLFRVIGVVS